MYYFRCFFHYFNAGSFRVHSSYLRINKFLLLIPLLYKVNILSSLFIDFYRASKVKNFDFEEEQKMHFYTDIEDIEKNSSQS